MEGKELCDQRTRFLVHLFIVNAVELLNKLSVECEENFARLHQRILRAEAALALLEAKLRSVEASTSRSSDDDEFASKIGYDDQISSKEEEPQQDDPRHFRFLRMLQVGVPEQAVKLQMSLEGLDSTALPVDK